MLVFSKGILALHSGTNAIELNIAFKHSNSSSLILFALLKQVQMLFNRFELDLVAHKWKENILVNLMDLINLIIFWKIGKSLQIKQC